MGNVVSKEKYVKPDNCDLFIKHSNVNNIEENISGYIQCKKKMDEICRQIVEEQGKLAEYPEGKDKNGPNTQTMER